MNNNHDSSDDVLRLVFGELDDARRAEVRKAIAGNAELSAVAQGLELAVTALRKECTGDVCDDFNTRLRGRWQTEVSDSAAQTPTEAALAEPVAHLRSERRWAWPAAFSAMTCVAATLFVMLMMRPNVPLADHSRPITKTPEVTALVNDASEPSSGWEVRSWYLRTHDNLGRSMAASAADRAFGRTLLSGDKTLPNDFWTYHSIAMNSGAKSGHATAAPEESLNNYELMQRLIKNEADGETAPSPKPQL